MQDLERLCLVYNLILWTSTQSTLFRSAREDPSTGPHGGCFTCGGAHCQRECNARKGKSKQPSEAKKTRDIQRNVERCQGNETFKQGYHAPGNKFERFRPFFAFNLSNSNRILSSRELIILSDSKFLVCLGLMC